jgi:hypothetical protein
VIIAVGPAPLQFMLETHERAFAGVPVIFCLPYGPLPGTLRLDPGVTGVTNVRSGHYLWKSPCTSSPKRSTSYSRWNRH